MPKRSPKKSAGRKRTTSTAATARSHRMATAGGQPAAARPVSRSSAAAAPAWRRRGSCRSMPAYEVSVFEQSWRLGGKGASGRDPHGRIHRARPACVARLLRERLQDDPRVLRGSPRAAVGARSRRRRTALAHASFDDAFFAGTAHRRDRHECRRGAYRLERPAAAREGPARRSDRCRRPTRSRSPAICCAASIC